MVGQLGWDCGGDTLTSKEQDKKLPWIMFVNSSCSNAVDVVPSWKRPVEWGITSNTPYAERLVWFLAPCTKQGFSRNSFLVMCSIRQVCLGFSLRLSSWCPNGEAEYPTGLRSVVIKTLWWHACRCSSGARRTVWPTWGDDCALPDEKSPVSSMCNLLNNAFIIGQQRIWRW